jgi:hypothetical protein
MPLRDHFHAPWSASNPWEGFHSAWVNTMVRHLNASVLPRRYRAIPQVHLGPFVETDLAAFDMEHQLSRHDISPSPSEEATPAPGASATWMAPRPTQTLAIDLPAQDVFEVRVQDERRGMKLVGVIELVSPGNKDRPEIRRAFFSKCSAYLQEQVSVIVVDVVTERRANLHEELLELLNATASEAEFPPLFGVSYSNRRSRDRWSPDICLVAVAVGDLLPTMPLWLAADLVVPVDLESSYEETCQVLRID